ncbi:hypothetical protein EHI42_21825 [Rhizobium hidalgonense]|nr:hypothetical protein EHI42_21825 [Rhizobium hidalgonense]
MRSIPCSLSSMSRKNVSRFCDHDMRKTKILKRRPTEFERSRHRFRLPYSRTGCFSSFFSFCRKAARYR